mmetsp:Transcript_4617/g.13061  ORF Transcript_4617/g.13061 Transcript_4617/m.13061 type:complete len:203 (-) Transcript_4617:829-1437(-)
MNCSTAGAAAATDVSTGGGILLVVAEVAETAPVTSTDGFAASTTLTTLSAVDVATAVATGVSTGGVLVAAPDASTDVFAASTALVTLAAADLATSATDDSTGGVVGVAVAPDVSTDAFAASTALVTLSAADLAASFTCSTVAADGTGTLAVTLVTLPLMEVATESAALLISSTCVKIGATLTVTADPAVSAAPLAVLPTSFR